jgi:TonB family protein
MPPPVFRPLEWAAPTNRLPLASDRPGAGFNRIFETNEFPAPQLPAQFDAAPTLPAVVPLAVLADQSTMQLEDGLAQRRLVAPLQLKSFTNTDILAASVVRVGVDAGGRPVSVTLLSSSGSTEADPYALEQARAARFEPVSRNPAEAVLKPTAQLSWGRMIFRWHTVPMPPASAPAARP